MTARTAKDRAPKTGAKRPRRRLGLSGRVAIIAVVAAFVAALAQWVVTPFLAQEEIRYQRQTAVFAGANLLADISSIHAEAGHWAEIKKLIDALSIGMPDGQSAVFDKDWKLLAEDGSKTRMPSQKQMAALAADRSAVLVEGERYFAARPIQSNGVVYGYAVYSFQPRAFIDIWLWVVAMNALVLSLVLLAMAPLIYRVARLALKPVTDLEKRIRMRDPKDKSKLADSSDDRLLKPLLTAIDGVHERSEAAMRRALTMAYTDPVTRLPNRLRFMSKLDAAVAAGSGAYMVICDLDRFRQVNVTYGPRAADLALATVAERLRASASQSQTSPFFVGRIGADQFGVIFPGGDRETTARFIKTAGSAVADPMTLEGQMLRVTASFGAACAPQDASSGPDLLKQAEVALKEAKRLGGGQISAFFDRSLLDKARAQSWLEDEVREGLERGEFVAVFQPKVKLETGELVGAEALARWRRPDGMAVSPGVFIPIAEELGLIARLGKQVMRDACFAAAGWNRTGIVSSVAVNVSPHQFDDPEFVDSVYKALDDSGLPPNLLELEITESAAVADADRVARTMWPLRNRGVRLAIDDFGTGHSNFAAITRLPFDVFKIDQQFVRALSTDPHAPAIVEMILAMAEALGQETVAEGVETKEQADFLLRRACTIGQGYYYSPPLPAVEFDAFVRSYRPRPADRFAA
ncbi:MAG: bifunctional diguanylate cyclase/phosphodiesterase [Hyphomonadaceae bacterium]